MRDLAHELLPAPVATVAPVATAAPVQPLPVTTPAPTVEVAAEHDNGATRPSHPVRIVAAVSPAPTAARRAVRPARRREDRPAAPVAVYRKRPVVAAIPTPAAVAPVTIRSVVALIPGWVKALLFAASLSLAVSLLAILLGRRRLRLALRRAYSDAVTGLPNRAAVDEALLRMTAQTARSGGWLGVLMLDLDHFKAINDTYGHAKGDEVLSRIGTEVRGAMRDGDFVGRFGGEELIVLLPDTGTAGARDAAEKLRRAVRAVRVEGLDRPVTASVGVAAGSGDKDTLRRLGAAADEALYRAKRNGRDRTETADAALGG
ncbi:MAG: hypothetical protein QOI80_482 [Solirubrobacteraceae bacterium]|nr:hypothetical protein [Solirubrobacteraceae bacterium]